MFLINKEEKVGRCPVHTNFWLEVQKQLFVDGFQNRCA